MDQQYTYDPMPTADNLARLREARHHHPHAVLGPHLNANELTIFACLPGAVSACLPDFEGDMERSNGGDLFVWRGPAPASLRPYRIGWRDDHGNYHEDYDPYFFRSRIAGQDLHSFNAGDHHSAHDFLGARSCVIDDMAGVRFATWAPNAERVSVVGDFNTWNGRRHPMSCHDHSGVWELFIPGVKPGALYRFEIRSRSSGQVFSKIDPYARAFERRPATASVVCDESCFEWGDAEWTDRRATFDWQHEPISIYEVHLGSWKRDSSGGFLGYREIADELAAYVKGIGFTHIELLPIMEHPLDISWGYQPTGFFAPTSRHGSADDFRHFVDVFHRAGIGVILDWVPGHFPKDSHALACFDGTALYEHGDPQRAEHPDWGTLIFNYGRSEVRSFLLSSAFFWLHEFHIDGLRVDAVASMLYLDYSRQPGQWVPNIHGGRENLEAVDFLRAMNTMTHQAFPGTFTVAEESTAWPQVTRPDWVGGLGFSLKWNMGWMHDILAYVARDPIHRGFHHDALTFGLLYAFHENFVLPLSHDEVVHGKKSLLAKMHGDTWQKFATLRALYVYMFTYPGKKLMFMGNEFGVWDEWSEARELRWPLLDQHDHGGLQRLLTDLARLYRESASLHRYDFDPRGFEWIDCHDSQQSVVSYLRRAEEQITVIVVNFTPVPREGYRIGVPQAGDYTEVVNSDSTHYGGSGVGNLGRCVTTPKPWMGHSHSLQFRVPPLGALVLQRIE